MSDKKYTIRPKGKTEPVFEVTDYLPGSECAFFARLAEGVGRNAFHESEWDIEETKPTTLDLLNDCGENAYVASRTNRFDYGYVKASRKWYTFNSSSVEASFLVERIENYGLEIIFEGVK